MIAVMDFQKKYGNEIVLDGVNFVLEKGKTLCVTGASGSGKSTLLRLLAGWESPRCRGFPNCGKIYATHPTVAAKGCLPQPGALAFPAFKRSQKFVLWFGNKKVAWKNC